MKRMLIIFLVLLCLHGCKTTTVFGVPKSEWNQMSEQQQQFVAQQYRAEQAHKELEKNINREREPSALRRQFHTQKNHGQIYDDERYAYTGEDVAPVEIKVKSKPKASWQNVVAGQVPTNAFPGGHDLSNTFYLCKAESHGNEYPGRVTNGICQITHNGIQFRVTRYKTFIARSASHWVKTSGVVPSNAVVGGREGKQKLFVCRAYYKDGVYPGKVVSYGSEVFGQDISGACYFSYQGQEVHSEHFEVLIG